ncbi:MAG: hypothetical protein H0X51_09680 [Parachlamydiaceae bacterium]|nr:hypothetical protein [Tatlockia sp.]MBA3958643.1 hypothetical protein [Parachlamydiaceae bacterium]
MKDLAPDIGFGDGSYRSCVLSEKKLIIYVDSWDGKTIKIIFLHPIFVLYRSEYGIAGVFEKSSTESSQNSFLKEALSSHYGNIPTHHPFRAFVIMDEDDRDFFEVVAESVIVTKE